MSSHGAAWRRGRAEGKLAAQIGMPRAALLAYRGQRKNADRRGIAWRFSLSEWWQWWCVDGRWERRGRGREALVMARNGDCGAYEPNNVHVATGVENHAEVPRPKRSEASFRAAQTLLAQTGSRSAKARPVITPDGSFPSAAAAGLAHGIAPGGAAQRAKSLRFGWRYADADPSEVRIDRRIRRAVITPLGHFATMADAARAHGMTTQGAEYRAKRGRCGWRLAQ